MKHHRPDQITPDEQEAIARYLKRNEVTRVPPGATVDAGYHWDGKKLVASDPSQVSWRNGPARGKPIAPATAERRMRLRDHMRRQGSARDFAEMEGVPLSTVYTDASAIGFSFKYPGLDRTEGRQAKALELRGEGLTQKQVAERLGVGIETVRRYEKAARQ
jgi:DNA-binding CsgD family transcriptional regulator